MLEKRHLSDDAENLVPNLYQEITNSMKRPKPAPRNINNVYEDGTSNDNTTLKSYNPNRKLKRNRNSYSMNLEDKYENEDENKLKIPQSPTNYKQPPTPEHPPPSSSHAEKLIHERIRPLSQEYKRRSAFLHLQKQQQLLVDMGTSPLRQLNMNGASKSRNITSHYDYAYIHVLPTKLSVNNVSSNIYSTIDSDGIRGSLRSLNCSVFLSDHSGSTENVEEFIGDEPFAGLLRGSLNDNGCKQKIEPAYAMVNKVFKISPPQVQLPPPRPQQQLPLKVQVPVYATIHKKRGITTTAQATELQSVQKYRPPIPAKPIVPERRLFKTQTPQLPITKRPERTTKSNEKLEIHDNEMKNEADDIYEFILEQKTVKENNACKAQGETPNILSHQNSINSSPNDEQSQLTLSQPTKESSSEDTSSIAASSIASHESTILRPFNADEARKKISEILESFGSSILNSDISPTNELDFDDTEISAERQELVNRLKKAGLVHLEKKLFDEGYDNYKFLRGIFEERDIEFFNISQQDGIKLLKFISTLPKAEFSAQFPQNSQRENKLLTDQKGASSLHQWLHSIQLPQYIESFSKHLYNTLDSVYGVWDVELQTVLEINKLGHRHRILQSIAFIKHMHELRSVKISLAENNKTNKISNQATNKDGSRGQSITGYRKNRPAPQPPTQKAAQQTLVPQTTLNIRTPSELLLSLPDNVRTKWRHSVNELLKADIKYEVYFGSTQADIRNDITTVTPWISIVDIEAHLLKDLLWEDDVKDFNNCCRLNINQFEQIFHVYLGSTVVKELRGTESTRKSIQKLKQDQQHSAAATDTDMLMSSQSQTNATRNQSFNKQKRILVSLAISHTGVEFIDVNNKNTICEHEIQNINCARQDADDLQHFAYITKENDIHYCHVFFVESTDLASDIILTLGQAFEVAYQLALRDGITDTPLSTLNQSILHGILINKQRYTSTNQQTTINTTTQEA